MMLALRYDNTEARGDLCLTASGGLATDDTFASAVEVALFTDRRAPEGEPLPDPKGSRRGWWGDMFAGIDNPAELGRELGSLIWMRIDRGKMTQQNYNLIREDIRAALAWMIEDGVAASLEVVVERASLERIAFAVGINRPDDPATKWIGRWEAVANGL